MSKKKYAVIGHPIGHTMSPFIHKMLFDLAGIDAEYTALDIAPEALAGEYERTVYSCCINADEGIYYYKTYSNNQITRFLTIHFCLVMKGSWVQVPFSA